MATPRTSFPRPNLRRLPRLTARGAAVGLVAATGVLLAPLPASAAPAPASASQAAALTAARAHDLEAVTEKFNAARDRYTALQAKVDAATATVAQAKAVLADAQAQLRTIARSEYTGDDMSSLAAMMTSDSADEFVDRVSMLHVVATNHGEVVGRAAAASQTAAQAQATATQAAAEARKTYDAVARQQADLQKQVTEFQAAYDRLSAREKAQATDLAGRGGGRVSRSDRSGGDEQAPSGPVVATSQAAQVAVNTALAQQGKPYVWAASGPGSFDCSGLVQYAYRAAGVSLPHSSAAQAGMGRAVSRSQLQPGDLIAFYSPVSHIGIYIGNGKMVHAPTSGDVVKIASIDVVGRITAMRHIAGG